ncbi:AraC family transcriptional regulator [Kibdelosporangium persicum]|uniref:HTH-type transcriptional repressor of iron proteins A n=1 Tax=Kibdelosporangium persicum TaxID=2698649 RepID=A0ABX2F7D8_9PSEU|nr:AraC family transcriptional regulator [Kibdelosporangium persicum]NRN67268.1 HTH-type transcriptional repressor of iron proteins A [Kibdelosporangium persicum]
MRHVAKLDPELAKSVIAVGGDMHRGGTMGLHEHAEHLISWSATAMVSLRTATRDWLIPPTHGLWMPAGCPHAVEVFRPGRGYAVVLNAKNCPITWTEPTGVLITPLVRELIVHLDQHPEQDDTRATAVSLLLSLLEPVPDTTFHVPLPEDPRTREIAEALIADPADHRDLAMWAVHTHSSVRTITRLFAQETGMTFAQWRTHARVRAALIHLAQGASVGATARAVGYHKPGAFAEAFRRVTGQHPSVYL